VQFAGGKDAEACVVVDSSLSRHRQYQVVASLELTATLPTEQAAPCLLPPFEFVRTNAALPLFLVSSAPPVPSRISSCDSPPRPDDQEYSSLVPSQTVLAGWPGSHDLIITRCAKFTNAHCACRLFKACRMLKMLQAFPIADPKLANRTRSDALRSEGFLPCAASSTCASYLPAAVPRSDTRSRLPLILLLNTGVSRLMGLISITVRSSDYGLHYARTSSSAHF
jgi:hypothetical protein